MLAVTGRTTGSAEGHVTHVGDAMRSNVLRPAWGVDVTSMAGSAESESRRGGTTYELWRARTDLPVPESEVTSLSPPSRRSNKVDYDLGRPHGRLPCRTRGVDAASGPAASPSLGGSGIKPTMSSSSPAVHLHLERLRGSPWQRNPGYDEREQVHLIGEVGRIGRPDVVPVLLSYLFGGTGTVSATAAGSIEEIVRSCSSLDLARLDPAVREVGDWQWPDVGPADVVPLSHRLTGTLGVIASHRSGHVREA